MKTIRHSEKEKKVFSLYSDIYKGENKAYKKKAHEEMQRNPYTTQRKKP